MGLGGASSRDGLIEAARSLDVATLGDARFGFHRAHSQRSARRVFYITQVVAFAALGAGLVWAVMHAAGTTFFALHIAALILFTTAIAWRLVAASILTPPALASRRARTMANLHDPLPTLERSPRRTRSRRSD